MPSKLVKEFPTYITNNFFLNHKNILNLIYNIAETSQRAYNTRGNYVWLRADISNWTAGTISRIELNR